MPMSILRSWSLVVACLVFLGSCSATEPEQIGSGPKAVLTETSFNFGDAVQGERVSHAFPITNAGNEALIFEEIWSIGTLPMIVLKRWLPPGQEDKITLVLDTGDLRGEAETGVILHTNDAANPVITLKMQGKVKPPVEVRPFSTLYISASKGEAKEGAVTIVNNGKKPLNIAEVSSESGQFQTRLETVQEGREYRLVARVNPQAFPGRSKDVVHLSTDSEQTPEIEIPVKLFIKDAVFAFPDSIDFGTVNLEALRKTPGSEISYGKVLIKQRRGQGEDFGIKATSDLPFLRVAESPVRAGESYQLEVFLLKENLPKGSFTGKISVQTTNPAAPQVVIPVFGEIP